MTLDAERKVVETFFRSQWGTTTKIGFDAQTFTPEADSVQLTINPGARLQGTMGRTRNRIDNIGTLVVAIYTDGAKGSSAWRKHAETIINFLHGVTLDSQGVAITSHEDAFLRFSPTGINGGSPQHPYVSASFKDAPFTITNITAPFTRYSLA